MYTIQNTTWNLNWCFFVKLVTRNWFKYWFYNSNINNAKKYSSEKLALKMLSKEKYFSNINDYKITKI